MNESSKKFLEFNGTNIYFIAADGQFWVALKPICEALGVNWNRQYQNLKNNDFLKAVYAQQQMQAPDNQLRNYVALPEFYVYGWIMEIQSSSPELLKYKWECYRILYEHFHGAITGRKSLLRQKAEAQNTIDRILAKLDTGDLAQIERERKRINKVNGTLRTLDAEIIEEQRDLFSQ